MSTMTARDHLVWASNRALEYYDAGDKTNAIASFVSDVCKHPSTTWIANHPSTLVLLETGYVEGRDRFKYMMEGFAVSDLPYASVENAASFPSSVPFDTASEQGRLQVLFGAGVVGDLSTSILAQEAGGQQSFVNSATLPSDVRDSDRRVLEQAGVVFGDQVHGDDMFVNVILPEDWTKTPTEHSMWSDLVDEKGRKRASIFYKAAFYDRSAHLNTNCRFGIHTDYDYQDVNNAIKVDVTDGDQVVFSSEPHSFTEGHSLERYAASEAAFDEARTWLEENYPQWEDASAYWD